jgi:putative ABC transport system permease protein
VRAVTANLSRTAVAAAALTVAVASSVQIGLMIGSFRSTVADWLTQILRADLYVAQSGDNDSQHNTLPPEFVERLRQLRGVAEVSSVRHLHMNTEGDLVHLAVYQFANSARGFFRLKAGDPASAWQALETEDVVLISEPFAYRRQLAVGAAITLPSELGPRDFKVAGVYYDYSSDRGVVMMSRNTYNRYWQDRQLSGLGIYVQPGLDLETIRTAIRDAAPPDIAVEVRTNRRIREHSLAVFDRTFIVTQVLQILATTVAFLGVLSALMALQLDRAREHGLLRAVGMTPGQLARLVVLECGLLGLAAGLFALPVGVLLARSLAQDINQRSFGWALDLHLTAGPLLQGLCAALLASLLAAIYPALSAARRVPADALRME